jgi:hypothetical protein
LPFVLAVRDCREPVRKSLEGNERARERTGGVFAPAGASVVGDFSQKASTRGSYCSRKGFSVVLWWGVLSTEGQQQADNKKILSRAGTFTLQDDS